MIQNIIRYNESLRIISKTGNANVISEEEYNSLVETFYLNSIPGMKEKLVEGLNTPLEETISEEEVIS
jgi:PHD/YefM family antitoxin component YafN of YafNO toxin-antitoxin module